MLVQTFFFASAAQQSFTFPVEATLVAIDGSLSAIVTSDPTLTFEQFDIPTADGQVDVFVKYFNGDQSQMNFAFFKGQTIFITPRVSGIPGTLQLFFQTLFS